MRIALVGGGIAGLTAALALSRVDRRETTARIVLTNRAHGPDRVLEIARERRATSSELETVFPYQERAETQLPTSRLPASIPPCSIPAPVTSRRAAMPYSQ